MRQRQLIFDARFKTPFNLIITGPSQSVKSTFIFNLLKQPDNLISTPFDYIVTFSGSKENMFYELDNCFTLKYFEACTRFTERH